MIEHDMTEKEALVALLPFYLSGKIERADRDAVEAWLEADPEAPALLEKIAEERHGAVMANERYHAPAGGLARLMADVAVTRQEKTLEGQSAHLLSWLKGQVLAPLKAAPSELAWAVCGLLMLVTIGQSYVLYQGPGAQVQGPGYELASGERHEILSFAIVKFKETAPMSGIADALDEVGALIVDGPTASGQFTIGFIARDGAPALADREKQLEEKQELLSLFVLKPLEKKE